jgi:hypothetical protein
MTLARLQRAALLAGLPSAKRQEPRMPGLFLFLGSSI